MQTAKARQVRLAGIFKVTYGPIAPCGHQLEILSNFKKISNKNLLVKRNRILTHATEGHSLAEELFLEVGWEANTSWSVTLLGPPLFSLVPPADLCITGGQY